MSNKLKCSYNLFIEAEAFLRLIKMMLTSNIKNLVPSEVWFVESQLGMSTIKLLKKRTRADFSPLILQVEEAVWLLYNRLEDRRFMEQNCKLQFSSLLLCDGNYQLPHPRKSSYHKSINCLDLAKSGRG